MGRKLKGFRPVGRKNGDIINENRRMRHDLARTMPSTAVHMAVTLALSSLLSA